MKELAKSYKHHFSQKSYLWSIAIGWVFFIISLIINYYAGTYATEKASSPVTDIILSNTRTYDVDGLFIYGAMILVASIAVLCFAKPKRLPFVLKEISLFVLIRSMFIVMTHLGPFPLHADVSALNLISRFSFGGDLFFSGHTGLPFLIALCFWQNKTLRYLFLVISVFFGTVVLLGHLHYTIDVMSAFFITYGIHQMAKIFFEKDYNRMIHTIEVKE